MTDLTTREVSQRLMGVEFSADYIYEWVEYIKDAFPPHLHDIRDELGIQNNIIFRAAPAYSASTLFEWLREWWGEIENGHYLKFRKDGLLVTLVDTYKYSDNQISELFTYKTSLADMLAEAIIWILTQEKENK